MSDTHGATLALLFADIEGSTRLWDQHPQTMRSALAQHDNLARGIVAARRGILVKQTGDGFWATFRDPADALSAAIEFQQALADPAATVGLPLRVRCGLHVGFAEIRGGNIAGAAISRAARIMTAAHGGQILVSQSAAGMLGERLPADVVLRDLGSVRLQGLASPEHMFQVEHPALQQNFPALRSLDATPNNLPQQITSFVGRDDDIAAAIRLLERHRLVTFVGPGGIGKTRLSLQVAAMLLDPCQDGVWFVQLAAITDPAMVVQALMHALSIREEPGKSLLQTVVAYMHARHLLLILDNCEHVLGACADLVNHLLRAAPRMRVIASSREPLRIAGEQTYTLSPLALPDDAQSFDAAAASPAVRLFAERAKLHQPGFALNTQNVAAIVEICRRLDGIPLALELAAARVRTLPVDKIALRLNDRFQLLTGGSRTALPRQRTLHALIEWSYDLLTDVERIVFARLSVFAGGFTLEAAEGVCAGGSVNAAEIVNAVTDLSEKSLLVFESREAAGRYAMLQTIREFAREKLAPSPEGVEVQERHLAWCLALALEAEAKLPGGEQGEWLDRLDPELENILAAHEFCGQGQERLQAGLELLSAVRAYWIHRGLFELGSRLIGEALARPGAEAPTRQRARALFAGGQLAFYMGDYARARAQLEENLALARQQGEPSGMVLALSWLGHVASAQGERAAARGHLEAALALARELADNLGISVAVNALAEFLRTEGDLDAAIPLYEEGIAINRALSRTSNVANALLNVAAAWTARGNVDTPQPMLCEALALAQSIGSRAQCQFALDVIAGLALARGHWAIGARLLGASEAQLDEMRLQREPPDVRFIEPLAARARQAMGAAAFDAAHADGRALAFTAAMSAADDALREM